MRVIDESNLADVEVSNGQNGIVYDFASRVLAVSAVAIHVDAAVE